MSSAPASTTGSGGHPGAGRLVGRDAGARLPVRPGPHRPGTAAPDGRRDPGRRGRRHDVPGHAPLSRSPARSRSRPWRAPCGRPARGRSTWCGATPATGSPRGRTRCGPSSTAQSATAGPWTATVLPPATAVTGLPEAFPADVPVIGEGLHVRAQPRLRWSGGRGRRHGRRRALRRPRGARGRGRHPSTTRSRSTGTSRRPAGGSSSRRAWPTAGTWSATACLRRRADPGARRGSDLRRRRHAARPRAPPRTPGSCRRGGPAAGRGRARRGRRASH